LTENADTVPEQMRAQLQDFVDADVLTLEAEPMKGPQMTVYYNCMRANYRKYNWLAFIDIDEFLVLRRCGTTA
jgi:hypothetical protein